MFEPKVPVICAVIGFVLSFLTGLLSGVSFSVVLVRAIILAVAFGGLAFGGKFLIQKFVPDLLSASPSESASASGGNAVDITVGGNEQDENPFAFSAGADAGDIPDFAREQHAGEIGDVTRPQDVQSVPDTGFQPDPFLSAASGRSVPARAVQPSGDFSVESAGGLDVLPDLADFIPQVTKKDGSEESEAESSGGGSRESLFSASDIKGATSSAETDTMAKAIRTILTRDA
jgi:hypothetical protein